MAYRKGIIGLLEQEIGQMGGFAPTALVLRSSHMSSPIHADETHLQVTIDPDPAPGGCLPTAPHEHCLPQEVSSGPEYEVAEHVWSSELGIVIPILTRVAFAIVEQFSC